MDLSSLSLGTGALKDPGPGRYILYLSYDDFILRLSNTSLWRAAASAVLDSDVFSRPPSAYFL